MPSSFRVPKAPITGVYGRVMSVYAKRTWGEIPDVAYVLFHHTQALKATMSFEGKLSKWKALDANLKSYAQVATASAVGCSWCMDFGYFLAHNEGLDVDKVRQVPVWRESTVFSGLERDVLEYAEAMSVTPLTVTDEMVSNLTDQLGVKAVVELTKMISVENERARFNAALGLASQGYSDRCELAPLAVPAVASSET